MKLKLLIVVCGIALQGCSVMNQNVSMADLKQPRQQYVADQTHADNYPGFLTGEGNDLGCRYGIHFESASEFSPPKAQIFSALLAEALPKVAAHQVVLQQFDVYYNYRLRALHTLGSAGVGGFVGAAIQQTNDQAARQNLSIFVVDKILIDTKPWENRHPDQNQVGCDNRGEGEYYPSEISGGHDVVVTWLKFTVDNHPYFFRTYYQFQPADKAQISAGIDEAIHMSIRNIALQLQI